MGGSPRTVRVPAWCVLPVVLLLQACGSSSPADPCEGQSCSEHGRCETTPDGTAPYCVCDPGFHPSGEALLACEPNDPEDPCAGIFCSGFGECRVEAGVPVCDCDDGYEPDPSGLLCFPEARDAAADFGADAAGEADGGPDSGDGGPDPGDGGTEAGRPPTVITVRPPGVNRVDIVVLVDDSGSMSEEQTALTQRFPEVIRELFEPSDRNGDGRPDHAPADDVNIGIISSDMGTMGYRLTTCLESERGADGCFLHEGSGAWECSREFPPFLARNDSNLETYAVDAMSADFGCLAMLGTEGCGFEQQLKAMRKALVENAAPARCNDGFLRPDSLLALIWVTDEEDCSIDPAHPEMFDPDSTATLGHLNIRCFLHPELMETVDAYYEAFRALRPTRPDSIVMGMIVGVPPDAPECNGYGDQLDRCLEVPEMVATPDPEDATRLLPSCRTEMGLAYPPVRFVQLAQHWGKQAYVGSICQADWSGPLRAITDRLVEKLFRDYACLPDTIRRSSACRSVCWLVETLSSDRACGEDSGCPAAGCPPATPEVLPALEPCRRPDTGAVCEPLKRDLGVADGRRRCLVRQATRPETGDRCGAASNVGWFYVPPAESEHSCPELAFRSADAQPLLDRGSGVELVCPAR